ncbi:MAG: GNAT family N-acetyltransferase [Candidatus Hodarchaeales archaeon]|jgi:ribosomal-protein-alanine N-acetyltransferase
MIIQKSDFYVDKFNFEDFKHVKFLRENMYGPFSISQTIFLNRKKGPERIVILRHKPTNQVTAYMILHTRDQEDAWIYQLGYNFLISNDGLKPLIEYAEEFFRDKTDCSRIRVLVRDTQTALAQAMKECNWKEIDSIAIYEKHDINNIPIYRPSDNISIREADPVNDIESVLNVDRSAFKVGHRVPKGAIKNHLTNGGSFVAVDKDTKKVIGYNYNAFNTNTVGHFIRLATLEGYKRKGVGSALLHNALTWFNAFGVQYVYLRSIPDSSGSRLYEKFGFSKIANECTFELRLKEKENENDY